MARSSTPSLVDSGRRAADKATKAGRRAAREARDAWQDAADQAKQNGRKAAYAAKRRGRKAATQARSTWQEVSEAVETAAARTRKAASDTNDRAHDLGREAGRRAHDTREALAGRGSRKPRRRFTVMAVLAGVGLGAAASAVARRLADRDTRRLERLEARIAAADADQMDPAARINGVAGMVEHPGTVTDTADRPVLRVPAQATTRPGTPQAGATPPTQVTAPAEELAPGKASRPAGAAKKPAQDTDTGV